MGKSHFPFHAFEVGKNQFRQIRAVTAFEQAEQRHVQRAQRLAEPVKILRQQRAVGQRVAHVGVESGGHGDEVGLEIFQIVERAGERGAIGFARRARRDGIIETIVAGDLPRRCRDSTDTGGRKKTRRRAGPAKWLPCRCRDARQNQKRRRVSRRWRAASSTAMAMLFR